MDKTIFWNTDTQRDFMQPGGALYIEGAEEIIPNLLRLTNFAEEQKLTVINTGDWHLEGDEEISNNPDFKTTFPPHCMACEKKTDGKEGRWFIPESDPIRHSPDYAPISIVGYKLKDLPALGLGFRNIILYKNKFDIFKGNPHTEEVLKQINPDKVVVYGVATGVCVNYAVEGLLDRGYKVSIVQDAVKELPNSNEFAYFSKWLSREAELVTTDEIIIEKKKNNDL